MAAVQPRRTAGSDGLPRLLPPQRATGLAAHLERYGPAPRSAEGLITLVERAGLTGKGGAAFPLAVKLTAVAAQGRSVVVANGTEGEPASAKDKTLLASAPHLVLDGAILAALAVGAREVVVCVERGARAARVAVEQALAERTAGRADPVAIRLAATPSRYLAGEETALVRWINGGEAKPTFTPPRPYEKGVGGRPTLVNNVETLAHLSLIARFGDEWFRRVGTPRDPGTTLVTLSGVPRPGVYEVVGGAELAAVLSSAGTFADDVQAVLIGGYFGSWMPVSEALRVGVGAQALQEAGASLGSGVIAVLPHDRCGLAESARVARWLAGQSSGQCGPCVNGLTAIAGAMEVLVRGDVDGRGQQHLDRWLTMVEGRGACKHPDGTARFVESSLRVFAAEIAGHRLRGPCRASARTFLPVPQTGAWR